MQHEWKVSSECKTLWLWKFVLTTWVAPGKKRLHYSFILCLSFVLCAWLSHYFSFFSKLTIFQNYKSNSSFCLHHNLYVSLSFLSPMWLWIQFSSFASHNLFSHIFHCFSFFPSSISLYSSLTRKSMSLHPPTRLDSHTKGFQGLRVRLSSGPGLSCLCRQWMSLSDMMCTSKQEESSASL